MEKTYNGYSNYETWRINLELYSDNQEFWNEEIQDAEIKNAYDLSHSLKEWLEMYIDEQSEDGIVKDYALAFIDSVNYFEIAEHIYEEYRETMCSNCNSKHDNWGEFCSDSCKKEYWLLVLLAF